MCDSSLPQLALLRYWECEGRFPHELNCSSRTLQLYDKYLCKYTRAWIQITSFSPANLSKPMLPASVPQPLVFTVQLNSFLLEGQLSMVFSETQEKALVLPWTFLEGVFLWQQPDFNLLHDVPLGLFFKPCREPQLHDLDIVKWLPCQ